MALTEMGFTPTASDDSIWVQLYRNRFEHVGIYHDELEIASHDPSMLLFHFTDIITCRKMAPIPEPVPDHVLSDHLGENNNNSMSMDHDDSAQEKGE